MKRTDALGLGPYDGKTVIPVAVWLPVLVVVSLLAAIVLTSLDGESAWLQLGVAIVAFAVVVPTATLIARRWQRRRPSAR